MRGREKSVPASEASMASQDARRENVTAKQESQKIVAHELEERCV